MANGGQVTYEVTAITPDTQYAPNNTIVTGKRVSFKMSTGYEGTIFIPDVVFHDRSAVVALIEGEVKSVAAAQAITGTVS